MARRILSARHHDDRGFLHGLLSYGSYTAAQRGHALVTCGLGCGPESVFRFGPNVRRRSLQFDLRAHWHESPSRAGVRVHILDAAYPGASEHPGYGHASATVTGDLALHSESARDPAVGFLGTRVSFLRLTSCCDIGSGVPGAFALQCSGHAAPFILVGAATTWIKCPRRRRWPYSHWEVTSQRNCPEVV
jgi:hypothetical protein